MSIYPRPTRVAISMSFVYGLVLSPAGIELPVSSPSSQVHPVSSGSPLFIEAEGVMPLEERSRRKWDNALVADLDQDGKMDILLTEHGLQARLYWNNGGTFSEPVVVINGDTHGVSAGDYDRDGRMDLVIYHGGGGGKKPRNPVAFHINRDRTMEGGEEFSHFERSRGRAAKLIDADNDGALDLVLSAFPLDTQREEGANQLLGNTGDGSFDFAARLPQAKWMGFRLLTTDFDQDGVADLIFYGGADLAVGRGEQGLAFSDATSEVLGNLTLTPFVSSLAEIDFDNDGDFDLFVTRADHPFEERTCYDEANSRFAYYIFASFTKDVVFQYDLEIEGDFAMENLQMAYPDFDVYIGADKRKMEFAVDRHGGKDFVLKPEEAKGWPSDLSDNGLNIGHLGEGVWRVGGETKSSTAGVVLHVKAAPETSPRKVLPAMLWENRGGTFVDVTEKFGISVTEQTTSAAVGDLDNDGFSDIVVVRDGNPAMENEQIVYLNQGGKSFARLEQHGLLSRELGATGGAAELIDYDQDGDLDLIYSNERGRWHLYTNQGLGATGPHNHVTVKVGASPSNGATSQGAVLTLQACGNVYSRVVGATSSPFSQSANSHLHVGLGPCETIDRATVRWTNGETQDVQIKAVNQSVSVGRFE